MVSGAPRSRMYEIDNSAYWQETSGLGTYMGLVADAGPLGINRCNTVGDLKSIYTKDGKITASHGVDYQVAKRICNTVGLELFIGRVLAPNALYAGCVVPCGTTASAYSLSTGLEDPEDFTFTAGTGETAEQASIVFADDVNGSYGGTAFYLPGREYAVSFTCNAAQEINEIYLDIDDLEELSGKFFKLPDKQGYVWFNLDGEGTDPGPNTRSLNGLTGYSIQYDINASADTIATTIVSNLAEIEALTVTKQLTEGEAIYIRMVVDKAGLTTPGSQGTTGWNFLRTSIGADEIPYYPNSYITTKSEEESANKTIEIIMDRNASANTIATAVRNALSSYPQYLIGMEGANLTVALSTSGPSENAANNESYPTPAVITTVVQGSKASGTDAIMFYYNNPAEKGNNYGIKIYNCEDFPQRAQAGTFQIEIYVNSNTRVPESTVICSRNKDMTDENNRSLYVEDVLERLTNIRAINNTNLAANELPRSTESIVWFGGGSSGRFTPNTTEMLNSYIDVAQPLRDREEYAVSLLLAGGFYAPAYLQTLDKIAQDRGEACMLCGCPLEYETSVTFEKALERWVNEEALLTSSYSAMFSPHMMAYDDDNGRTYALPVECCAAEQIAFANENYSIAEPILGFARGTLQGVTGSYRKYTFTDDGQGTGDKLYDNRINPIRYFRDRGYVIWGQKTQQRVATKRDRLNVRLMLISLKPLLNQIQMNTIGELPTQATKKRLEGQLRSVLNVGVGRNWFKPNYNLIIESDPTYEAQHIQRIFYEIEPYDAIEYVQGYIVITNGIVSEITQSV